MSERVSDESLRHYLVGQDSLKECDCFQCKCALDLLDARKQIAEQAEELQGHKDMIGAMEESARIRCLVCAKVSERGDFSNLRAKRGGEDEDK